LPLSHENAAGETQGRLPLDSAIDPEKYTMAAFEAYEGG
jgi:hypothetical protein